MRTDRVLGGAVVLIVALATTSGVLASRREGSSVTAGGPVAAVQTYLRAVVDGRLAEAGRWIDPDGECAPSDLVPENLGFGGGDVDVRADLVSSSTTGSTATVQVDLRFGGGTLDPFGAPGDGGRQLFELRTVGGGWRLTGMPWPLLNCTPGG